MIKVILKRKDKLKNEKSIDLVTNLRDNSKESDDEKIFLKRRYIVENIFSWLKIIKNL